jgi:hypothetical protein
MYGKLLFVVGLGAGYLFGTSRGRKDFEKFKRSVSSAWLDPRVQKVAKQATDFAEENIPMGERVTEAADAATKAARATVGTTASRAASPAKSVTGTGSGSSSSGSSTSGGSTSGAA